MYRVLKSMWEGEFMIVEDNLPDYNFARTTAVSLAKQNPGTVYRIAKNGKVIEVIVAEVNDFHGTVSHRIIEE